MSNTIRRFKLFLFNWDRIFTRNFIYDSDEVTKNKFKSISFDKKALKNDVMNISSDFHVTFSKYQKENSVRFNG